MASTSKEGEKSPDSKKRKIAKKITYKVFNDPIHGHIELHPLVVQIIDTPQFQRLRYIKQLGGGYFVFPGASHNRFEHSIGVAHLAGKLLHNLRSQQPELSISDKEQLCVQIAGLCHDLGHGPFSHLFGTFMEGFQWKHEAMSVIMFDKLIEENVRNGTDTIEEYMRREHKLEDEDFYFIKELIYGRNPPTIKHNGDYHHNEKWPYRGRPEDKSYLYEIVANNRNGIDVDKMDYFVRDCHHLGMKSNFSHERFMVFARVCTVEYKEKQICMRDKEALNMYELFHVRFLLHSNAYQHRVTKAVELMIVDVLHEADQHFRVGDTGLSPSAAARNLFENPSNAAAAKAYLHLTDDIFQEILRSTDPNLSTAKRIIMRIQKRDLYKFVGGKNFPSLFKLKKGKDGAKDEDWVEVEVDYQKKLKQWLDDVKKKQNVPQDFNDRQFKVLPVKLNYGKKNKNPIESLRFYSKDNPDEGVQLKEKVSYLLPTTFAEVKVMVFYRGKDEKVLTGAKEYINNFWSDIEKTLEALKKEPK